VSLAPATLATAPVAAAPLSLTFSPVVLTVSPASAPLGSAPLLVTVTGQNFLGTTGIEWHRAGGLDPTLTTAGLTVQPGGTQLSFTLTITGGAPLGARILRVRLPAMISIQFDTGGNTFTVTAP
jgi:hypothetical protein